MGINPQPASIAASTATDRAILRPLALAISACTSLLFLVVYSSTNWITSLRTNVGTWRYEWEDAIPFVPWMVIPYMSIDLFFVVAPFLCRSRPELTRFAARVTLAIVAAGICFLAFPLRLAVQPPAVSGVCGLIFDWFRSVDQPYNLCPSLHIALRSILAATYATHLSGLPRLAARAWFSLIGFSTVLTYQHHVVDVAGGFVLAAICFYVSSEAEWRQPVTPNYRVAAFYGLAFMLACAAALAIGQWGVVLLWPATNVALVTLAYCGLGPAVYRKADGQIPMSARLLMGPFLFGQFLSWLYYRRQCRPWDEVMPGLWIGRQLTNVEARQATSAGVTAVLDLTSESSETQAFRSLSYRNLRILDLTAPTHAQLDRAVEFIDEQRKSGIVYVHCKAGYSRTAAVVGTYLLARGHCDSAVAAISLLKACRPAIIIRPEARMTIEKSVSRLRNP